MGLVRALSPFVQRYWGHVLIGIICAICSTAATAAIPQILGAAVDELNVRGVVFDDLLRYAGLLLAAAVFDGVMRYGLRRSIGGASYLIETDMREAMFRRLLTLDQAFYSENHTGDLMARVTNDLSAVRTFLGPGMFSLIGAVLLIIASAALMLARNALLATLVLLLLPATAVLFVVIGGRMRAIYRTVQDQFGEISTRAQENFSGIRTIKAYAQEAAEVREFRAANERYRTSNVRYVLLSGLLWPLISVVLGAVGAMVLLVGGRFVAEGTMTVGDLVLFNIYLAQLGWPMIALGWTVDLYQQASASMVRISELLQRRPTVADPPESLPAPPIAGAIEFRDVGIRFQRSLAHATAGTVAVHDDRDWVLRHVSFSVPQGTSLAIVGATGIGKTTLVNLLARVRDPDEGQVLVDGRDVRVLPLADLRRAIGYVPQDTFLFSVPLKENVTFGKPDAEIDAIERALRISRLSNDLIQFPNGIETMIGERGVTLSGGQKQRTAIARAVLRDPAILVLDDALSSVDAHTAAEILAELRDVMRGRTSLIIAQRIATVKDADQVIVLHAGGIAEQGTHRDLLRTNGLYAAMYRRELIQSELEGEVGVQH